MEPIYFDARFIRLDYHDGISRFSVELIKALTKKHSVVALISDSKQLDFLPENMDHLLLNSPQSIREIFIAQKLNKVGAKVVFSPMQVMGSFGRKYKLVLTLHDLIYYRHRKPPQDLSLVIRAIWRLYHLSYLPQRLLLNRADVIVTVSETTKRLIKKYRLTKKPVQVIYNAVTELPEQKRSKPVEKNLVYVGSFMPYKNVESLIRAAGLDKSYKLHLLSKITPTRQRDLQNLADQASANVIFHNGVTDEQYQELLETAFAFVSASKDEGFGIPLVEAMARSTPVVVSDLEIFREVAGDAGTYFDPESPEKIIAALQSLENPTTWKSKSETSYARSKLYSWESSAEKLHQILTELGSARSNY